MPMLEVSKDPTLDAAGAMVCCILHKLQPLLDMAHSLPCTAKLISQRRRPQLFQWNLHSWQRLLHGCDAPLDLKITMPLHC